MVGAMLVGAWLLIHQQCCASGFDTRMRGPLIDTLSRRSAFEKNFMRFGRSVSANTDEQVAKMDIDEHFERLGKANTNFMRFGKSTDDDSSKRLKNDLSYIDRESEGPSDQVDEDDLENLKSDDDEDEEGDEEFSRVTKPDHSNFIRFGRSKNNFIRFGRAKDNFIRFGRGKENFMRFGKNKNNFMRFGKSRDGFIRFGRGDNVNSEDDSPKYDDFQRPSRAKGNNNFIRFGRSTDENHTGAEKQTDSSKSECTDKKCHLEGHHHCANNLDPNVIVAPEFSLLPRIQMKPTHDMKSSRNFMRLG